MVDVKAFGAVGDGVADDSTAIQTAITNAKSQKAAVFFPYGKYKIPSLGTQAGRVLLVGFGDATLIGNFSYSDSFPASADTLIPPTEDSPFFSAQGLNFKTVNGDYALTVTAQAQTSFITTAAIENCRFYGRYGLKTQNLITFHIEGCLFHNTNTGWCAEGCTNGSVMGSKWHNQASYGVLITSYLADSRRLGGENIRFSNCEWAVCSYGIYAERHDWLSMSNSLLDYCGVPLRLVGSNYAKAVNTYFGAALAPHTFKDSPDYTAFFPEGISIYAIPFATSSSVWTVGASFGNCDFVNYTGNSEPTVYFEGNASFVYRQPSWNSEPKAERIQFNNCLFLMREHSAETILQVSNAIVVGIYGNRFEGNNQAGTIQAAYRFTNCISAKGMNNDFHKCRDANGNIVTSPYETL
jgi:hypothetical protein